MVMENGLKNKKQPRTAWVPAVRQQPLVGPADSTTINFPSLAKDMERFLFPFTRDTPDPRPPHSLR